MRLVNIGPGEIVDRLTILALKILYGSQQAKEVTHFETERNALLVMLRGKQLDGPWFEQVLGLAAVNAALWQAEDNLRYWRNAPVLDDPRARDVAGLAFRIQTLNDQRASLIEAINKATGDHRGAEKI